MTNRRDFLKPQTGGRNMMYYLNTLLALVFCVLMTNVSAQAEQIGANTPKVPSTIQGGPSTPLNAAPTLLQVPLVIGQIPEFPSLCNMIPNSVTAINQKKAEANAALQVVGSGYLTGTGSKISYYRNEIESKCCSTGKSFSVQEQQAAGCIGSDTVQVCMDKLTKQCMRNIDQKINMKEDVQKAKDSAKSLSDKTGKWAQEMLNLLTIMP